MEIGINLDLTKSIAELDKLLDEAIEAAGSKKLSVPQELHQYDVWRYQIGKFVEVDFGGDEYEDEDSTFFWIGYGWEETSKPRSCIWLEFNAGMCPERVWDKVYEFVGTSGKYHADATFDFVHPDSGIVHFILKDEYLKPFFGEGTDRKAQMKILVGFINEVMEKL